LSNEGGCDVYNLNCKENV